MKKRWIYCDIPRKEEIDTLSEVLNINPSLAGILIQRGISDFEAARDYFRPSLEQLHDPFLMQDMDKAVDRLALAIEENQPITVYGDYDVDGTTAVALVYGFLRRYTSEVSFYVNDREGEGYGISEKGIERAAELGSKLIISLDCGIKAGRLVSKAKELGMDFIICDHHTPGQQLPDAVAVLDPKRSDCSYPFKELSGCGVGFKLLQGYCRRMNLGEDQLFRNLDLMAVSIAADIVPMVGENRIFTYFGLKQLEKNPSPGLQALIKSSAQEAVGITGIVFGIAPRINAAGRIAHANQAVSLLLAENEEEAQKLSEQVNENNSTRRNFDSDITDEALEMIRNLDGNRKSTVLFKSDWHKGVVGIVASRCIEEFHRPTIILTGSNGKATGSARSVPGFDIYEAISRCDDLLEKFGGHKYAAGLTLPVDKIEEFSARFEEVVASSIPDELLIPPLTIDASLDFDLISTNFVSILKQMEPFGPGNKTPVFESLEVFVQGPVRVLKEKHIKFRAGQKGCRKMFDVIGFGMAELEPRLKSEESFTMAYCVELNTYMGETTIQLRLKDIKTD